MVKLWHDLDCICDIDSSEPPDPALLEHAHWLELEYFGDDAYFLELRLIDSERDEISFYMSRCTTTQIYDYLRRALREG